MNLKFKPREQVEHLRTKGNAKRAGLCNERILLNKYNKAPKTEGVKIKNEIFYDPEKEEAVKSKNAWQKEGRIVAEGTIPAGQKCMHRGKVIWYDVYRERDTTAIIV